MVLIFLPFLPVWGCVIIYSVISISDRAIVVKFNVIIVFRWYIITFGKTPSKGPSDCITTTKKPRVCAVFWLSII